MQRHRSSEPGYGWVRLWAGGLGLAWKPREAHRLFSERAGLVRFYPVGRWRVRILWPEL